MLGCDENLTRFNGSSLSTVASGGDTIFYLSLDARWCRAGGCGTIEPAGGRGGVSCSATQTPSPLSMKAPRRRLRGQPMVLLVEGDPGTGKSKLLAEVVRRAPRSRPWSLRPPRWTPTPTTQSGGCSTSSAPPRVALLSLSRVRRTFGRSHVRRGLHPKSRETLVQIDSQSA